MAKVTGPLFSLSASGTIAKSMVHQGWKGLNVVRGWVKPANPKTGDQGDARMLLGGLGRAASGVDKTSLFAADAKAIAAPGQTWISTMVKYVLQTHLAGIVAYEAEEALYAAHAHVLVFAASAASLGLVTLEIDYAGTTKPFAAGMQLYCLGLYGIDKHNPGQDVFNRTPYDDAMADWDAAAVAALEADVSAP